MSAAEWALLAAGGLLVWIAVAVPCALVSARAIARRDLEEALPAPELGMVIPFPVRTASEE